MSDLWIRSQDKQRLLKVDDIVLCYESRQEFKNGYVLYPNTHKEILHNEYLGIYSTKEKAMAVLDEIEQLLTGQILSFKNIDISIDEAKQLLKEIKAMPLVWHTKDKIKEKDDEQNIRFLHRDCVVYTMPEDV